MAQAYREITAWEDGNTAINHTYYLEGDSMLAYMPYGKTQATWFTKPIRIDRRGRKFLTLKVNPFDEPFWVVPNVVELTRTVAGSNGAQYVVNLEAKTCTCPGYTFRGVCKHVKQLESV
jgi:hypothetical protein